MYSFVVSTIIYLCAGRSHCPCLLIDSQAPIVVFIFLIQFLVIFIAIVIVVLFIQFLLQLE